MPLTLNPCRAVGKPGTGTSTRTTAAAASTAQAVVWPIPSSVSASGQRAPKADEISNSASRTSVSTNSDENNPIASMPDPAKAVRAPGQRRFRPIRDSGNSRAEAASSTPSEDSAAGQPARDGISRRVT